MYIFLNNQGARIREGQGYKIGTEGFFFKTSSEMTPSE
jgi:hypothetical protein